LKIKKINFDIGEKMKKIRKFILIIMLIIVLAIIISFLYLKSTLPKTKGKIMVTTLKNKVEIIRNRWGIPNIKAYNMDDLYFAIGYVHASDRMFQMDMARRYAEGKLSEIIGKRGLSSDKNHKKLLVDESINGIVKSLEPELYNVLKKYSEGVNYYLKHNKLAPEFIILKYKPERWSIRDSIAIFKNLETYLQSSGGELYNYKIMKAIGKEKATKILSTYFGSTIVSESEYNKLFDNPQLKELFKTEENIRESKIGSNNWVISGERTKSGKPILANDPHLPVSFPSQFYQIYASDGKNVLSGNTMPGIPTIIIGRNKNIGWGFTNIGTDVIDYFILKINPENKTQYLVDDEWKDFIIIKKRIKVKGEKDCIYNIKMSEFGPVYEEDGVVFARHSLALYPSTTFEGIYLMNMATNLKEFIKGLGKFSSPAQNCVFADTKGNIGYYPTGLIPIRGKGDGTIPILVTKMSESWQGFYKESEKPIIINPEKGYMATANNPVIPKTKLPLFTKEYDLSFRADRIKELINNENDFTIEKIKKMQTDLLTNSGKFLIEKIKDFEFDNKKADFIIKQFKKWDFKLNKGIQPYLFYIFEENLAKNIFSDEFKGKYKRLVSRRWIYKIMDYPSKIVKEREIFDYWVDDKKTLKKESFKDIVLKSLKEVYDRYKKDLAEKNLNWENLHKIYYSHPLGSVSILKPFFNRGPYSVKGGRDCILRSDIDYSGEFRVDMYSTFRIIIDFGDFKNSVIVNSSGESGNFMSKHYDDQIKLYLDLKYRKMDDFGEKNDKLILMPE
jgi:penicillin amidase